jgi:aspartyl/asparaginyl beta-hydroxylase (cupin superfamily)
VSAGSEPAAHAAFVAALVGRMLDAQGLDPRAAELVAGGLRVGRDREQRPPDRWQQPTRYYPGLGSKPWHEPADFPWTERLREAFAEIRAEALALQREGRFAVDPLSANLADGDWNEFRFYTEGTPTTENLAACPQTAAVLAGIPGAATAGLAYFSAVGPGTHLRPHCGPHNARLRTQLGLVVPDGCELRVGPQARHWDAGDVVVFDDSFEHELFNDSDQTRIVLIVDVWHPDLSPAQIVAIRYSELAVVEFAYAVAERWVRTGAVDAPGSAVAPQPAVSSRP